MAIDRGRLFAKMIAGEIETTNSKEENMVEIIKEKITALETNNVSQDVINTWIGYLCLAIDREDIH